MHRIFRIIIFLIALGIERHWQIPLTWILLLIMYWRHEHRGIFVLIATLIVDLTLLFPLGISAVCIALASVLLDFTPSRLWLRVIWLLSLFGALIGVYAITLGNFHWQMAIAGIIAGIWFALWKVEPDSVEIGNA